jgi:hypothetical protein
MTVRAAIVGTGFWARTALIPSLTAHPAVEIVALVDPDIAAATAAHAEAPAAVLRASLEEAFARDAPIDLVVVGAPDHAIRRWSTPRWPMVRRSFAKSRSRTTPTRPSAWRFTPPGWDARPRWDIPSATIRQSRP